VAVQIEERVAGFQDAEIVEQRSPPGKRSATP
jgi:hypothetical protein